MDYLEFIRQSFLDNDFEETLFFTADNTGWTDFNGGIQGVLQTANTHGVEGAFKALLQVQPDMPLMVMEFYPGWITHWFDAEKATRDDEGTNKIERILTMGL